MKGFEIKLQIYAEDENEALEGQKALIDFVEYMRQYGAAVRGKKLKEAVSNIDRNTFVRNQIINFFK